MHEKLVRGEHGHRADPVQGVDEDPELPVAAQHHHHAVALLDAERNEVVRGLAGHVGDLFEREFAVFVRAAEPGERDLVRRLLGQAVEHVVCEVERVGIVELDLVQDAVFVELGVEVVLIQQTLPGRCFVVLGDRGGRGGDRGLGAFAVHDDGEEFAGLSVRGDHAVRQAGVQQHAVARLQHVDLAAELDAQAAGQHVVELVPRVRRQVDRQPFVLRLGRNVERFRIAVLQQGCEVAVIKLLAALDRHAFALARDVVQRKLGRLAAHKYTDIDTESLRAEVKEGERTFDEAVFMLPVFFYGDARDLGHFLFGDFPDLTDVANAIADLLKFVFHLSLSKRVGVASVHREQR